MRPKLARPGGGRERLALETGSQGPKFMASVPEVVGHGQTHVDKADEADPHG